MGPGEDVGGRHLGPATRPAEERPEHPGVALDRPARARAAFLLGQEGDDRLLPGRDVVTGGGGEELGVHRRHLGERSGRPHPSLKSPEEATRCRVGVGPPDDPLADPELPMPVDRLSRAMHTWLHRPTRRRGQIVEVLGTAALVVLLAACVGAGVPGTSGAAPTGSTAPKPVSTPSAPIASDQVTATPAVIVVPPPVPIGVASASPTAQVSAEPLPTPLPTTAPTAGHASDLRTITLADDGATVSVAVGEQVLVKLGTDLVWTVQISDPTVLVRVRGVALIVGAQGLYAAAKAGTTLVTAIGDAACRTAVPPCMVPTRLFSVTIVVH